MKKVIVLLLVSALIISLVACGVSTQSYGTLPLQTEGVTTEGQDTTAQTEAETESTAPTQTGTEPSTQPEKDPDPKPGTPTDPQPSEGAILETKPGDSQSQTCSHIYRQTATTASTCAVAGTRTYTCTKCNAGYTEALALLPHEYAEATCTAPKTCKACSQTSGSALGHDWNSYGYCKVCGVKNTEPQTGPVTFKATIKSDENLLLAGVTVNVYTTSSTQPAGSAVTNHKGVATMTIERHSSYKVVLTNVPAGYSAKESYSYTGATVTINLKTEPVYDPLDHSKARYKEGDTMVDFTLKDIDGNTYTLSQLKKQKKLIILDFWYVNCGPCKQEFPYFEKALAQYGDQIAFLALNPLDSEANMKQLREEMGVKFPMAKDNLGMAAGFDVTAYPVTVMIDSSGKIRAIHRGAYDSEAAFLRAIERYL